MPNAPGSGLVVRKLRKTRGPSRRKRGAEKFTKRLLERALAGEMTHYLGYQKHAPEGKKSGNSRNGHSSKTLTTGSGQVEIKVWG